MLGWQLGQKAAALTAYAHYPPQDAAALGFNASASIQHGAYFYQSDPRCYQNARQRSLLLPTPMLTLGAVHMGNLLPKLITHKGMLFLKFL